MPRVLKDAVVQALPYCLMALMLTSGALARAATAFSDVSPANQATRSIETLVEQKILTGYPDGTFRPHRPVTRAEFAVMLTQCGALLPAGAGSTGGSARFADVSGKHWAFNAIQTVTGQGWMSGYPHAHFRPNQDISTQEVYAILARRSAAPPLSGAEAEAVLFPFQDNNRLAAWARVPVAQALKQGLRVGALAERNLYPALPASRASIAMAIARLLNPAERSAVSEPAGTAAIPLAQPGPTPPQAAVPEKSDATAQPAPVMGVSALPAPEVALAEASPKPAPAESSLSETIFQPEAPASPQAVAVKAPDQQAVSPDSESTAPVKPAQTVSSSVPEMPVLLTGRLKPSPRPGDWWLIGPDGRRTYVLQSFELERKASWFRPGAEVTVSGLLKPTASPFLDNAGTLIVRTLEPSLASDNAARPVALYFPNLVNLVSDPRTMLGAPTQRTLSGPNLHKKAVESLLSGPTDAERQEGYFIDDEVLELSLKKLAVSPDGKALVLIQAPGDFQFRTSAAPQRLEAEIKRTLSQFTGIREVKLTIQGFADKVLWSSDDH